MYGTNTDWEGYYKTPPKTTILKVKVLILGYGGAVIHTLCAEKTI